MVAITLMGIKGYLMDFRNFLENIDPRARKIILRVFIGLFIVFVIWWFAGASLIEIELENELENREVSYSISGKSEFSFKERPSTVKKLVRSGTYEIKINQGDRGYYQIVNVGGFLQTTKIKAELSQESERVFTGNNPSPCTTYYKQKLYSYVCGGDLNELRLHVPATAKSPTYTVVKGASYPDKGRLIKLFVIDEKLLGLVRATGTSDYFLYEIDDTLKTKSEKALPTLSAKKDYATTKYLDGVVIYDSELTQAHYLDPASTSLSEVDISQSRNKDFWPRAFSASTSGKIVVIESNNSNEQLESSNDPTEIQMEEAEKQDYSQMINAVRVFNQNKLVSSFEIKGQKVNDSRFCGKNICILTEDWLGIYTDNGEQIAKITNVDDLVKGGDTITFSKGSDVVDFDPDSLIGRISYSLASSTYCGSNENDETYTICLIKNDQKFALTIDPSSKVSDLIDRKVFRLIELAEVKNLSINRNYIHIVSNFVPSYYNPKTDGYEPDPVKRENIRNIILDRAAELGISSSDYKIVTSP